MAPDATSVQARAAEARSADNRAAEARSAEGPPGRLAWLAAVGLLAVAAIRCAVSIAPQVRFDTDPAINPMPYVGFGPTGSLLLDALLLGASALALTAEARAGRRVRMLPVLLATLPGIAVAWHGASDATDLFRGATWLAAAMGAVAAMHLARERSIRRVLIAGSVGVVLLLAVRGAEQVTIEHAQTVGAFEADKARILAQFGWEPGSAAARTYERRLMQAEAAGWFGLANLFSAMMAFGTVLFAGQVVEAFARRGADERRGPWVVVAGVGLLLCAALLVVNGSKGSIGVAVLGIAWFLLGMTRRRRALPILAVAVVLVVALLPVLRGFLPESFGNEKSLLFRWQYLLGAKGAAAEALRQGNGLGLGPDGFQDAYLRTKPEHSPEDVISAHAMAVDWLVLLGPLGAAWIALVIRLLVGCARRALAASESVAFFAPAEAEAEDAARRAGRSAVLLVAALILLAASLADGALVSPVWIAGRLAGIAAFLLGTWAALRAIDAGVGAVAVAGAIIAVVAQGQIEMIFFQPGMVAWIFVLLGVAAAGEGDDGRGPAWTVRGLPLAALAPVACASLVLAFGVLPQWALDRALDRVIDGLAPVAAAREAWPEAAPELRAGKPGPGVAALAEALAAANDEGAVTALRTALAEQDPGRRVAGAAEALAGVEGARRVAAGDALVQARSLHPTQWQVDLAAINQFLAASRVASRGSTATQRGNAVGVTSKPFEVARALAEAAAVRWRTPRFLALRAAIALETARSLLTDEAIAEATKAMELARDAEPLNATRWSDLGDLSAAAGRDADAKAQWTRALAIDAGRFLDPMAQMSDRERAALRERIDRLGTERPPHWPLAGR